MSAERVTAWAPETSAGFPITRRQIGAGGLECFLEWTVRRDPATLRALAAEITELADRLEAQS